MKVVCRRIWQAPPTAKAPYCPIPWKADLDSAQGSRGGHGSMREIGRGLFMQNVDVHRLSVKMADSPVPKGWTRGRHVPQRGRDMLSPIRPLVPT